MSPAPVLVLVRVDAVCGVASHCTCHMGLVDRSTLNELSLFKPNTTARQVMDERDEEGAIKPHHLREAHRRAVKEKRLPVMRSLPPAPAPTPPKP